MQKKSAEQHNNSNWEDNIKKQERMEFIKKFGMWGGIAFASFVGLAILVLVAGRSGTPSTHNGADGLTANENLPPISLTEDMIVGNPNAQVTVIKYSDFQCPACASYNPVMNQILATYPEDVRIVYRHFPLKTIHQNAQISGQAAYAAWKLGKFKEMKDELFNNQDSWATLSDPSDEFVKYAKSLGMDEAEFVELMNSKEAEDIVNAGQAESISLGLQSTPSFFIGNKQFSARSFEDFQALINEELGSAPSSSSDTMDSHSESAEPTLPPLQ